MNTRSEPMKSSIYNNISLLAFLFLLFITPSFSAPTPGAIKVGTKITLKVVDRTELPSPIPSWIPKYRIGQKVTFQIGKNGELKIPSSRLTLRFFRGNSSQNVYSKGSMDLTDGAEHVGGTLYKNPLNRKTMAIGLFFFKQIVETDDVNIETIEYVFR